MIALGNSLTSIYAGFIVFGTLGVLAEVGLEEKVESFAVVRKYAAKRGFPTFFKNYEI